MDKGQALRFAGMVFIVALIMVMFTRILTSPDPLRAFATTYMIFMCGFGSLNMLVLIGVGLWKLSK